MDVTVVLRNGRERILQIAAKHGVRSVRVFGSAARGDADECSDIDLLVDMPPDSTLLDQAALLIDLRDALGCKVDVLTEQGLKPRIREQVLREAVPL